MRHGEYLVDRNGLAKTPSGSCGSAGQPVPAVLGSATSTSAIEPSGGNDWLIHLREPAQPMRLAAPTALGARAELFGHPSLDFTSTETNEVPNAYLWWPGACVTHSVDRGKL